MRLIRFRQLFRRIGSMHLVCTLLSQLSQFIIDMNDVPAAYFMIEQCTILYMDMVHFFQTDNLCCQLDFITLIRFCFPRLYSMGNRFQKPEYRGCVMVLVGASAGNNSTTSVMPYNPNIRDAT